MRTIHIPAPIKLNEQESISLQQFVINNILHDHQFGRDFNSLEICLSIKQTMETAQDICSLQDNAWELLSSVVQHPSHGYDPKIAVKLVPFMKAIINAEKV